MCVFLGESLPGMTPIASRGWSSSVFCSFRCYIAPVYKFDKGHFIGIYKPPMFYNTRRDPILNDFDLSWRWGSPEIIDIRPVYGCHGNLTLTSKCDGWKRCTHDGLFALAEAWKVNLKQSHVVLLWRIANAIVDESLMGISRP